MTAPIEPTARELATMIASFSRGLCDSPNGSRESLPISPRAQHRAFGVSGFILLFTFVLCVSLTSSLAAPLSAERFTSDAPAFDPMRFFTGYTRSSGVFENRSGDPTRRVRTETRGRMFKSELQMEQELFVEGRPKTIRSWRMRRIDAHRFVATANDIVGTARGVARGNHFRWTFTLALKRGNPLFKVRMSQDMYLQPDGQTMVNRTRIRKFGILVAQVTEQFRRQAAR